ncbi:Oidioi.mRNA.OKI2018_I69.PAR.g11789.t1.cds [Oikopleura dioica]|uniref:Oidioi.mRNA.OKI2018_I69.PAR.g11789.t1.cds n=1 Tax=Oikopleura dioica TaxID=34765 RepID=A0ABN7S0B7_OIKDI|nr:Oidioi.mRNA.OKI2018_I69.PAR.g11789.t1.cds [Oikopleura dioica]
MAPRRENEKTVKFARGSIRESRKMSIFRIPENMRKANEEFQREKNKPIISSSSSRKFFAKDDETRRKSSTFSIASSYIIDLLTGPTAETLPDSIQHQMRRISLHGKVVNVRPLGSSALRIQRLQDTGFKFD